MRRIRCPKRVVRHGVGRGERGRDAASRAGVRVAGEVRRRERVERRAARRRRNWKKGAGERNSRAFKQRSAHGIASVRTNGRVYRSRGHTRGARAIDARV